MKQKKIIFTIGIAIFIIILLDFGLVLYGTKVKNQDQNLSNNNIAAQYECTSTLKEIENEQIQFTSLDKYTFIWDDNGLRGGRQINELAFKNKENYETINWQQDSNIQPVETEFNETNLTKKYTFEVMYSSEGKDLNQYIQFMEEQGYNCKKIGN